MKTLLIQNCKECPWSREPANSRTKDLELRIEPDLKGVRQ